MIDPITQHDSKNLFMSQITQLTALMTDDNLSDKDKSRLLFERGKLYWKMGDRTSAVNDYLTSLEADPESPAALALEYAREIESFFNPDLFNP